MKLNLAKELAALEQMTVGQLQQRYAEILGENVRSRHKQYLIRRIAWRLQANAEGGLSERALRRAEELADVADVRVTPPRGGIPANPATRAPNANAPARTSDARLPPVGVAITRNYKGRTLTVTVLADGFEYAGERYPSLTAVAKAITGSHMNGFRFFQIEGNACCQVVPLVDGLVRVIGKRALDKLHVRQAKEGDKITGEQIKAALDKMLDQGFVPDQIITSGIPDELMPRALAPPRIEEATMSIRSRVEDSQALMSLGRADGALLSALVAVAATSRKRYPKSVEPEDGKAFTRFLGEEMRVLTAGAIVNVNVAYPGADPAKYPDRLMPLQDVLYKFVRCALIHEGGLPGQVEFIPVNGLRFQVLPDKLILTQWLIQRLHVLVQHAPENIDEFPEVAEVPADVIGWVLFGPTRPNHADYLAAREERLKAVKASLVPQDAAGQQPPSEHAKEVGDPNAHESS